MPGSAVSADAASSTAKVTYWFWIMSECGIGIRTRLALALMLFLPLGVAEDPALEDCNFGFTPEELLIDKAVLDAGLALEARAFVGSNWQVAEDDEGIKQLIAVQEIRTNLLTGRANIATSTAPCVREE